MEALRRAALALLVSALVLGAAARVLTNESLEPLPEPFNTVNVDAFFGTLAHKWIAAQQTAAPGTRPDLPRLVRAALLEAEPFVDAFVFAHSHGSQDECGDCKAEAARLQRIWFSDAVRERLAEAAIRICIEYNLFSDYICEGAVALFRDTLMEVVGHSALEPLEVCARRGICTVEADPSWNATFPAPKPPVRVPPTPKPETPRMHILHLTDMHYDPSYTVGLEAECEDPLCCRPPLPEATIRAAGRFGDYRCDAPLTLIKSMLDYIVAPGSPVPAPDYILWTGDIPPHDVWESTRAGYIELMGEMADLLHAYFPNTTIIPAIGNHESVPVDEFAPVSFTDERFEITWLYEALANQWSYWLPEDAQREMLRGGSFAMQLEPGLRAISINDEGCSGNNWWLRMRAEGGCCVDEFPDPDNMLHWLIEQLQLAEDAGDRVILARHVPNANRCNNAWSSNYDAIVERYENTILGIFSGHTHDDEMVIHYADMNARNRATAINFIAPAVTPYTQGNPAFRVYEVAADSFDMLDYETYILDLEKANSDGVAKWFLEYKATEAYGMDVASPAGVHELAIRMYDDDDVFQLYYNHYHRSNPAGPCDADCREKLLCRMRTAIAGAGCP